MHDRNHPCTKKKIALYIDDGLRSTMVIPRLLQHFGYKTVETYYDEDTLQKVYQLSPDIIFLDNLHNLDVYRRLKDDERAKKVPLIIILYPEDEDLRKELKRMGVTDYITKPLNVEEFEALVKAYLADSM